jgi:hypothetical protein
VSRVLEEIASVVHERVPSPSAPTKRSSRIFSSVRRVVTDTRLKFSDKEKIKAMQQELQDAMNQFGVRIHFSTSAMADQSSFRR